MAAMRVLGGTGNNNNPEMQGTETRFDLRAALRALGNNNNPEMQGTETSTPRNPPPFSGWNNNNPEMQGTETQNLLALATRPRGTITTPKCRGLKPGRAGIASAT